MMIYKKSLCLLVCCRLSCVSWRNISPKPELDPRCPREPMRYGIAPLCCRPGYSSQVRNSKPLVSNVKQYRNQCIRGEVYMVECDTGYSEVCSLLDYAELLSTAIDNPTVWLCVCAQKPNPQNHNTTTSGWGFYVGFLPNKLKRPVPTVNEPSKQLPVPEIDNPDMPDLTLYNNAIY